MWSVGSHPQTTHWSCNNSKTGQSEVLCEYSQNTLPPFEPPVPPVAKDQLPAHFLTSAVSPLILPARINKKCHSRVCLPTFQRDDKSWELISLCFCIWERRCQMCKFLDGSGAKTWEGLYLFVFYKALTGLALQYTGELLMLYTSSGPLRSCELGLPDVSRTRLRTRGDCVFDVLGPWLWNSFPPRSQFSKLSWVFSVTAQGFPFSKVLLCLTQHIRYVFCGAFVLIVMFSSVFFLWFSSLL